MEQYSIIMVINTSKRADEEDAIVLAVRLRQMIKEDIYVDSVEYTITKEEDEIEFDSL